VGIGIGIRNVVGIGIRNIVGILWELELELGILWEYCGNWNWN
jgi:hypothetical protein